MKNSKRKAFSADLSVPKKEIRYLEPYYFQGGKWHKLKNLKRKDLKIQ